MKKTITLFFIIFLMSTSFLYANDISSSTVDRKQRAAENFLEIVKGNHPMGTWGLLEGTISNRRRDQDPISTKIRLAIRFTDSMVLSKITLGDDKSESYTVGQPYDGSQSSVIIPKDSNAPQELANYGIKPEDLTMSFLYWEFINELPSTSVKDFNCKVLVLENKKTKQEVHVYISSDYYYPMKVEWFKDNEKNPFRTYFINSFKKVGKLWAPDSFYVTGPGWRSNVEFDKVNLGLVKDGVPKDLF